MGFEVVVAKSFLASKTIWGAITTFVFAMSKVFGFDYFSTDELNTIIETAGILIGTIFTIWGRFKATQPVELKK